jgi:Peptidase family M23
MACALDEIVRHDRRWFRAHPQTRHRCRWPDTGELDLCEIRHLGRGRVVYQPVIFPGRAAHRREIGCGAVCPRSDIPRADSCHRPNGGAGNESLAAPIREVMRSCAAARLVRVKPGHSEVSGGMEEGLVAFLSALMAFGVMVGTSAQAAAEGLSRQRADLLNIAPERDAAVSNNQPVGEAGGSSWDLMRNEPHLDRAPAGIGSEVGHPIEITNATSQGESVAAPVSGRVVFAAPFRSYGPLLIVQHGEYHTVLWGFTRLDVVVEDLVVKGQTLGLVGGEGGTPPILHVESRRTVIAGPPLIGARDSQATAHKGPR